MRKLSSFIGKAVVCGKTGECFGTVSGVERTGKRITHYVISGTNGKRIIKPRQIRSYLQDVIVIAGEVENYDKTGSLVEGKVINSEGKILGDITEVYLYDRQNSIEGVDIGEFIPSKKIRVIGAEYTVLKNERKMTTQTGENALTASENLKKESENTVSTVNEKFLIGKTVGRNVLASNGEIIVRSGAEIDRAIIVKARENNKLTELAYSLLRQSTKLGQE